MPTSFSLAFRFAQLVQVFVEAGIEVRQPLAVDVRLEDAADLEEILLARERRKKPISTTRLILVSMLSTRRASLVDCGRYSRSISTICSRVSTSLVSELLASNSASRLRIKARRTLVWKGQGSPGDEPGQLDPVVDREAAQVGVTLGFVRHHLEAETTRSH